MLHLAELARKLRVPYSSLRQLVVDGKLHPDAVAGKFMLFHATRVTQVRRALNQLLGRSERFPAALSSVFITTARRSARVL